MNDVVFAFLIWLLRSALMAFPTQVVLSMWGIEKPYLMIFVTIAVFSMVYHTMLSAEE